MSCVPRLIVITGPTASGKSALAVEAARRLDTEIISADSRQIYRGIPVSTAVPTEEERGGVIHHLLETLDLDAYYSAALFAEEALGIARRLWSEGRESVIVCGGSMLYVDALCNGIDELPTVPSDLRASLQERWRREGDTWLQDAVAETDPAYWARADRSNLKRLFHALEVSLVAGRPYSQLLGAPKRERDFEVEKYCLNLPREELFERINARTLRMADRGLLEEARRVYPMRHLNSLNTVGLKEMFKVVEGEWPLDFALARMAKNTRVYAKKQLTWYRRDPEARFISPEELARELRL